MRPRLAIEDLGDASLRDAVCLSDDLLFFAPVSALANIKHILFSQHGSTMPGALCGFPQTERLAVERVDALIVIAGAAETFLRAVLVATIQPPGGAIGANEIGSDPQKGLPTFRCARSDPVPVVAIFDLPNLTLEDFLGNALDKSRNLPLQFYKLAYSK